MGLEALLVPFRFGQSDPADLLHKGSRSESWSQVVAQNTSRENKDRVQSSEQKVLRLFLVFLTVSHSHPVCPSKTNED